MSSQKWSQTIEIRWFESGQPRAYADSVYDAEIVFGTDAKWARGWHPPQDSVEKIAAAVMGRKFKLPHEERQWHETHAEKFEEIEPGRWRVRLIQPYCD